MEAHRSFYIGTRLVPTRDHDLLFEGVWESLAEREQDLEKTVPLFPCARRLACAMVATVTHFELI
jgi:hypothetical protein